MLLRIETALKPHIDDAEGCSVQNQIMVYFGFRIDGIRCHKVYKIEFGEELSPDQIDCIRRELTDPVIEDSSCSRILEDQFDYVVMVGFKPGVTDSVGKSTASAVRDILNRPDLRPEVFTETIYFFQAPGIPESRIHQIAYHLLANQLIQSIRIYTASDYRGLPLDLSIPKVTLNHQPGFEYLNLKVDDQALQELSRTRVLSLSLDEMKAIQAYYDRPEVDSLRKGYGLNAQPTDVELEVLAQTWSEHCKHKIFNARIDYTDAEGNHQTIHSLFKSFIQRSTEELKQELDYLVSVFDDNAGVIAFNDRVHLVYKAETHNSPSALDPYGGAMTGIVGVNRDPAGTGMGADLLINTWGYCFGSPDYQEALPQGMLHPRRIRDGVHQGVIDGGNQSGIPYGRGWEIFDDRYMAKPLVFCGTVGLLPVTIQTTPGHIKTIHPDDLIVMIGGRIGKDGIHGATFSSEELHKESPTQAVQIGDPITQKMMMDFLSEARQNLYYRAITDNGAGGLSSSVGEMCQMTGGCELDLALAPLKYQGLDSWEILISEAQERMTLAVPPERLSALKELAEKREVELTVLGRFTQSGYMHVRYREQTVALLDLTFLHKGLPVMQLKACWQPPCLPEISHPSPDKFPNLARQMLSRYNLASKHQKMRHYDHEVKGLSIIKPLIGKKGDVPSEAVVFLADVHQMADHDWAGILLTEAINPFYSDRDPYHMTAWIIDCAVRRALSLGGELSHAAGLDNFCWPDPVQSLKTPDGEYKLAQLVRSNQALYDFTKAFKIPLISGKDSMKNDAILDNRKISIPPTLLFSLIAKVHDIRCLHTLEPARAGDLIYILGLTRHELGCSEFYRLLESRPTGNRIPCVSLEDSLRLYQVMREVNRDGLAASAAAPALGGLFYTLFLMSRAAQLGIDLDLDRIPRPGDEASPDIYTLLFSESAGRMVLTVSPENQSRLESILAAYPFACCGRIIETPQWQLTSRDYSCHVDLSELETAWKGTFHA
ncbi:MAG: phosphoribosylformylglycinamidine synthase [Candidatus Delongbacteria bacterium]|nr:phosphoribosylformylglycinamidine synthase [Candidatus Delongbacteria bacterium]